MSDLILSQGQPWLQYFNRYAAVVSVRDHLDSLPSARTEERHTHKVYQAGLEYFFGFIGDDLPTPDKLREFVAHLINRGLKSTTISSKYLAPVRHYLKRMADQMIENLKGDVRDYVSDCREFMRQAAALPTPKAETTTNVSPLWRPEFTRLTIQQVNAVLRQTDRSTIAGQRDYALLHVAFSTGLRLAELARITPNSIQPASDDVYIITVRGKRSNVDPVPITAKAYKDLMAYITAYNADLAPDDPRRIAGNVPLWQPMNKYGGHLSARQINVKRGMSHQGIRDLIARRTSSILGAEWRLAAHDTRRTAAAIAYESGMDLTDIQSLLRHKDAAVTLHYVGKKPNFHERALGTRVQFG